MEKYFLFSIDLEDVRFWMTDGKKYRERVPAMTERYLKFLAQHRMTCTFFVVGDVAEAYPSLIREIYSAGHEIACHTHRHIPLDQQTPETFRDDLLRNMDGLHKTGVETLNGFRAPIFSLTQKTQWAYEILIEQGFTYSSSVLPATNPLYGWPEFGAAFRRMHDRIWELPITLFPSRFISVPCAGGLYFRTLPLWMTARAFRHHWNQLRPVLSYFHPYDIDTEQEHFMHPGLKDNRFYNWVMYQNRGTMLDKIDTILADGATIIPYRDYISRHLQ